MMSYSYSQEAHESTSIVGASLVVTYPIYIGLNQTMSYGAGVSCSFLAPKIFFSVAVRYRSKNFITPRFNNKIEGQLHYFTVGPRLYMMGYEKPIIPFIGFTFNAPFAFNEREVTPGNGPFEPYDATSQMGNSVVAGFRIRFLDKGKLRLFGEISGDLRLTLDAHYDVQPTADPVGGNGRLSILGDFGVSYRF